MNETAATKELRELDVKHLFHPYTNPRQHEQAGPIVIERGEGVYVYDTKASNISRRWPACGASRSASANSGWSTPPTKQMSKLPFYHLFAHKSH